MHTYPKDDQGGVLGGLEPWLCVTRKGCVEYADFGSGPVVVALHGAMGGWDQSAILAKSAFPEGCRVIAVSRPGYLGTPLTAAETPEAQADLVAALLDELGVERAFVIAISGGGPCALAFSLRHRARCLGLILVSTCSVPNVVRIPLSFHLIMVAAKLPFLARTLQRRSLARFRDSLARSIRDAAVIERILGEPETMALFRALFASTFDCLPERLSGTKNDILVTRTRHWPLEEIRVPVLVIHGTADRVAPFDLQAKPFATRIAGVRFVPVEGGEHVTLFTHLALVRREAGAFLAQALGTKPEPL